MFNELAVYDTSSVTPAEQATNPVYWNNSAITPGTTFMKQLHLRIIEWSTEYAKKHNIEII